MPLTTAAASATTATSPPRRGVRRPSTGPARWLAHLAVAIAAGLAGCDGPSDSGEPAPAAAPTLDRIGSGRAVPNGYVNDRYRFGVGFDDAWTVAEVSREDVARAVGDGWHTLLLLERTGGDGTVVARIDIHAIEPSNPAFAPTLARSRPSAPEAPAAGFRFVSDTIPIDGRDVVRRTVTSADFGQRSSIVLPRGPDVLLVRWSAETTNLLDAGELVVRTLRFDDR